MRKMNLVPYSIFGKLRLKKWFPGNEFLEEQDSWQRLINEGVRGVNFFRSMDFPEETLEIRLELFDVANDVHFEILKQTGLPLMPGNTTSEVIALLGEPQTVKRYRRRQTTFHEFIIGEIDSYLLTCTYDDEKGLTNLKMKRADIPYPKSGDEPDDSVDTLLRLDEFEVLPENISSPESPVRKVGLFLESSGTFRYLIRLRSQHGMEVQEAKLMIRSLATKHPSTIINLRLSPPNPANGMVELTGFIDKELLFRTFVELSMHDTTHNTSQTVAIEFDQWYGKMV